MIAMEDNDKDKEQLINELAQMRKRVAELEKESAVWNQTMKAIRAIETNYRLLLSAESDAIVIVDAKTKQIVDANDSAFKQYGYSREEFLQLKSIELSAEQNKSINHIKKVARGKLDVVSPGPIQRFHKKKDGTIFPVEISSGVFALQDRRMICAIFRDITKQKQTEEELREKEAIFRTIAEAAPAAIFIVQDGKYVYVNPGWEAATGYDMKQSFSMNPWDVIQPNMRDGAKKRASVKMQGQKSTLRSGIKIITKNGELKIFDHSYSIIRYHGEPAIFGIAIDITEQKRAEQALALERDKLQEALAKIKKLNGILPICSSCKKIRDDKGYWKQIESYIRDHSEAEFSHGICPECMKKLYPDIDPGDDHQ
jgi:PAS domain S-box-containing protein